MRTNLMLLACVFYAGAMCLAVNVNPVNAEDDCETGTFMVERLPIIGLACIGEPTPYKSIAGWLQ